MNPSRPLVRHPHTAHPLAVVLEHSREGFDASATRVPTPSVALTETGFPHLVETVTARQASAARSMEVSRQANPPAAAVRSFRRTGDIITLLADLCPLSDWVGSRAVFAELPQGERLKVTRDSEFGLDPLFATHLGITSTVVTSDGVLVAVRREGKLLADGLLDSAIGDTVLEDEFSPDWSAVTSVMRAGRKFLGVLPEDFERVTVAMLAVRVDDCGLWVSAHSRLGITAETLRSRIEEGSEFPNPARYRWLNWEPGAALDLLREPWTSWGVADLRSAEAVEFGSSLEPPL